MFNDLTAQCELVVGKALQEHCHSIVSQKAILTAHVQRRLKDTSHVNVLPEYVRKPGICVWLF